MAVVDGCRVVLTGGAGQGAHREVGSEGFEAKHRAVAEYGEPVGPIQVMPSLHYGGEGNTWGTWAQQGVCGRRGGKVLCVTPVFAVVRDVHDGDAEDGAGWGAKCPAGRCLAGLVVDVVS
jgi:hypothetical protein